MAHADAAAGAAGHLPADLRALLAGERDLIANCANAAALLWHRLPRLNWAGFYLLRDGELVLGPFQGKPACTRIALSRGVCGAAASTRATINVPDVTLFPGHIACDSASRSELVVPLLRDGALLGVLDLDSPDLARFDAETVRIAEAVAAVIAGGSASRPSA
ncbi:MAG: GAF domain-containing protein [Opitutales bacterium]